MKLFIMRHGEASFAASSDESRELTARGRAQTIRMAEQFLAVESFDLVIVSPYLRAQQTAAIACKVIQYHNMINYPGITPDGLCEEVLDYVDAQAKSLGENATILLVSHQPFVSHLIQLAVDGSRSFSSSIPPLNTSSIACLSGDDALPGLMQLDYLESPQ